MALEYILIPLALVCGAALFGLFIFMFWRYG